MPTPKLKEVTPTKEICPPEVKQFAWPEKINAKWIWTKERAAKINLRKEIDLSEQPVAAGILATCDNAFSITINGKFSRPIHGMAKTGKTGED